MYYELHNVLCLLARTKRVYRVMLMMMFTAVVWYNILRLEAAIRAESNLRIGCSLTYIGGHYVLLRKLIV